MEHADIPLISPKITGVVPVSGYSQSGARTSTIAEQYWSLPWDRQAVTVTLRAALTRHGTSARPVLMVMQGKKTKSCGAAEMANRPSTITQAP